MASFQSCERAPRHGARTTFGCLQVKVLELLIATRLHEAC
jgi:hypothetical protein